VQPQEAGLASGVVNTAFMMGGAVGLAILASVADSRTTGLLGSGTGELAALNSGYHLAFFGGAAFAAVALLVAAALLRTAQVPAHGGEEASSVPAVAEAD